MSVVERARAKAEARRQMFCSPTCDAEFHRVTVVVDYTDIDGTCRNCGADIPEGDPA